MRCKKTSIFRDKLKDNIINDIWALFEMKKKEERKKKNHNNRINMDRIVTYIRTIFEQEEKEEDYYEPKRVCNLWNTNYVVYESNVDKNINLSLDEYLNKTETYLKNIILNLQNSDTLKFQLTTAINFISSKDTELEHVMHSNSDNKKFIPYSDRNDIIEKVLGHFPQIFKKI